MKVKKTKEGEKERKLMIKDEGMGFGEEEICTKGKGRGGKGRIYRRVKDQTRHEVCVMGNVLIGM